ncbi:GerAB/ArcD/ProY family transporter [Sporomusa aerivorans]|uniref:GerAB/ArcD/ProY family transporter n=1 Tax=Sporomusa aerivorans TaxID=204936 RepID=UPI00352AE2F2
MKYQSGRLGVAEGLALAFVITFPPIFLSTVTKSVEAAGSIGWVPGMIAAVINSTLLYLYLRILEQYPGDLLAVTQKLLGKFAAWLLGLFYFAVFFGLATIWTRQFSENTLLTSLPYASFDIVILWYGLGSALLIYAGIEALGRAAYVIMPFCIIGLLLVFALLLPLYKPMYLLPWQGRGLENLITPVINLVGAGAQIALLLFLAPAFQTNKTLKCALLFGYGSSVLMRVSSVAVFIMIFGASVASEKMLPFYEMARLIYLNRYIQRLEAIFILLWVIVGLLAISLCLYGSLYLAAKLLKLPTIRPLIPVAALVSIQLAMLPQDTEIVLKIESDFFSWFCAPGTVFFPVALLAVFLFKGRRRACENGKSG